MTGNVLRVLFLVGSSGLAACLPANSLARHDELETHRYQLTAKMGVETTAAPRYVLDRGEVVPTFTWELVATLDAVYSRTFRDHSLGSLIEFKDVKSEFVIGETRVAVPSRLEGLVVELRSFDRGEVLALAGADAAVGVGGHLETLDPLWLLFAPHVQGSGREIAIKTGWPVGESRWLGYERVDAVGTQKEDRKNDLHEIHFSGPTTNTSYIGAQLRLQREGSLGGEVSVDTRNSRVVAGQLGVTRTVTLGCLQTTQVQELVLTLTHLGVGPPIPMVPFAESDSVAGDALRLRLQDGRGVAEPAVVSVRDPLSVFEPGTASDCRALVPFLVFPDTWTEEDRADVFRGG